MSKTGKQIPLWPDKKSTHSHDDDGNPIRKPLPIQNLSQEQTQQFNQYNRQQPPQQQQQHQPSSGFTATGQSQGGSYMDTKRLRVMVEEMQKLINFLDEKIESCYQLAKSNNVMLGELIQYFKINDPKSAKELYDAMQNTRDEALQRPSEPSKVKGWNSVEPGERQDFPITKTLKDDDDDDDDDDSSLEKEGL